MSDKQLLTQLQTLQDDVGYVELLEITNPSFSDTFRIVNDTQDFAHKGNAYFGIPFKFTRPSIDESVSQSMEFTMSNIGIAVTDELEQLPPNTLTMATLKVVSRQTPDKVAFAFQMPLTNVQCTQTTITASAGFDEFLRQSASKLRMNELTTPGLF